MTKSDDILLWNDQALLPLQSVEREILKVVPTPISEKMLTPPSILVMICLQILRPSPVPP